MPPAKTSALVDTRVIYCGDNLDQFAKLPAQWVELALMLKKPGSSYYHCDWHAAHHVKVMLDEVIGENCFVNEVIWKRQSSH